MTLTTILIHLTALALVYFLSLLGGHVTSKLAAHIGPADATETVYLVSREISTVLIMVTLLFLYAYFMVANSPF